MLHLLFCTLRWPVCLSLSLSFCLSTAFVSMEGQLCHFDVIGQLHCSHHRAHTVVELVEEPGKHIELAVLHAVPLQRLVEFPAHLVHNRFNTVAARQQVVDERCCANAAPMGIFESL